MLPYMPTKIERVTKNSTTGKHVSRRIASSRAISFVRKAVIMLVHGPLFGYSTNVSMAHAAQIAEPEPHQTLNIEATVTTAMKATPPHTITTFQASLADRKSGSRSCFARLSFWADRTVLFGSYLHALL